MIDISTLNPPQKEAVHYTEGPLLVLAGAGSGKTRVLTYRIANLIENHGVAPWHILALTFTNKAAAEMRERTEKLTGLSAKDMWVTTFHSFCAKLLRFDIEALGLYTRDFTIYDDADQNTVISDIIKRMGLDEKKVPKGYIRSLISEAKNSGEEPERYIADVGDVSGKTLDIYREYQKKLLAANALDFDDLLLVTVKLFTNCPEVLEKYRRRFEYVLVDEYQDTNTVQYRIVRLLCEERRNICVVGDDDQSIYGWRGADIRNILDFENDFPGAKVVRLEQNYRSTKPILDKANLVIKNNSERKDKTLWTAMKTGEPVELLNCDTERDEAYTIGQIIASAHRRGANYNDYAVLYRTHAQSRVIETTLQQSFRIPVTLIGGQRFYEYKEVKDILAYLRLTANTNDDVAFRRVVNVPKRAIGPASLAELAGYAEAKDISLFNAATMDGVIPAKTQAKFHRFTELMAEFFAARRELPLDELASFIIERTGYMQYLAEQQDGLLETRVENIEELIGAMREHMEENPDADDMLQSFLENAALMSGADELSEEEGTVKLMTLHSAKGLEFPVVFMPGMEENIFPSSRSREDENKLQEERRLCYVGVTRAKRKLYLMRCRSRMLYGDRMVNPPSRFLVEMELVDGDDAERSPYSGGFGFGGGYSRGSGYSRPAPVRPSASAGRAAGNAQKPFAKPSSVQTGKANNGFGQTSFLTPQPGASKKPSTGKVLVGGAYKVMQRVEHEKFGRGVITDIKGTGNAATLTVDFERYGIKRLAAGYVMMREVEDDR
ncbi:MAG: UvrD-helicase domain-containing protein [Clostridia bacterium]|nr:UvrD-helicase domain-containing protein [Clostridia bacterium]